MFFVYMYFLNCIPPCVIIDINVDDKIYVCAFKLNDLVTPYICSILCSFLQRKNRFLFKSTFSSLSQYTKIMSKI